MARNHERNVSKYQVIRAQKGFSARPKISREYLALRGNYKEESDPFFVFKDHTPVRPNQVRRVLKLTLESVNLPMNCYSFHGLRSGCSTDLVLCHKLTIEQLKIAGRWRSNVAFKYIKNY